MERKWNNMESELLEEEKRFQGLLSRIPVALAAGGMRNLNNPCYYEIHTKVINTFV